MGNTVFAFIEQNKLPKEEFKEIEGTDGKYYISSFGRVVSACGDPPQFLSPWIESNGYERIELRQYGEPIKPYVHIVVAQYFLEKRESEKRLVVHHKDKDKRNNKAENLSILTDEEHNRIHHCKDKGITENGIQ